MHFDIFLMKSAQTRAAVTYPGSGVKLKFPEWRIVLISIICIYVYVRAENNDGSICGDMNINTVLERRALYKRLC